MSSKACSSLSHWQRASIGKYWLFTHPDVELTLVNSPDLTIALIGFIIDPYHPNRSNIEILEDLNSSINSVEDIPQYLYTLSGRFVMIINNLNDTFIFHDPCGLRTVYFTKDKGEIVVGSQPLILGKITTLSKGNIYEDYKNSKYYRNTIEHWIPSGQSLYENIYQLIPNHYLQFSSLSQKRYWPRNRLQSRPFEEVVSGAAALLEKLIIAGSHRFKLALPLTAGLDSRTILCGAASISSDIFYYTLQYRNLSHESNDIRIPSDILKDLEYDHHVIDCRTPSPKKFSDIYIKNVSMAHNNDWGKIAYGMYQSYPSNRVTLKGNCSEICRCFYYASGKHKPINRVEDIIDLEPKWKSLPFIRDWLSPWYKNAINIQTNTDIDILDLFYWEHRMGSWQAQSQLEWDIVQEAYSPFNHRELLEMLLSVPTKYRKAPNYILYQKIGESLWPQIMEYPINPNESVKDVLKDLLTRLGIEARARKVYKNYLQK